MAGVTLTRFAYRDWPQVAPVWQDLAETAGCSFFLSSIWIETWLQTFGRQLRPEILLFERGGHPVGACLVNRRLTWRKGVPVRIVYLNAAGEDPDDETCLEYNSIPCVESAAGKIMDALGNHIAKRAWDELHVNAVSDEVSFLPLLRHVPSPEVVRRPSYYVDLARLRTEDGSFDALLSSNLRHQIRRTIRLYSEKYGTPRVVPATTAAERVHALDDLAALHQESWSRRGQRGAFASPRFRDFHRGLLDRDPQGAAVQLLRVVAGSQTIGVLYSFVHRGRVLFYQSGFVSETDNRLHPGLLSHYLAVLHCQGRNELDEYDFLAGSARYKRSLSTNCRTQSWLIARRHTLVTALRAVYRSVHAGRGPTS